MPPKRPTFASAFSAHVKGLQSQPVPDPPAPRPEISPAQSSTARGEVTLHVPDDDFSPPARIVHPAAPFLPPNSSSPATPAQQGSLLDQTISSAGSPNSPACEKSVAPFSVMARVLSVPQGSLMLSWLFNWDSVSEHDIHSDRGPVTRAFEVRQESADGPNEEPEEKWCCGRPPLRLTRVPGRRYVFTVRAVLFADSTQGDASRRWESELSAPVVAELTMEGMPNQEDSLQRLMRAIQTFEHSQQPSSSSSAEPRASDSPPRAAGKPETPAGSPARPDADASTPTLPLQVNAQPLEDELAALRYAPAPRKVNLGAAFLNAQDRKVTVPRQSLGNKPPSPDKTLATADGSDSDSDGESPPPPSEAGIEYAELWMIGIHRRLRAQWPLQEEEILMADHIKEVPEAVAAAEERPEEFILSVQLAAGRSANLVFVLGDELGPLVLDFIEEHRVDAAVKDGLLEHLQVMLRTGRTEDRVDAMDLLMRDIKSL